MNGFGLEETRTVRDGKIVWTLKGTGRGSGGSASGRARLDRTMVRCVSSDSRGATISLGDTVEWTDAQILLMIEKEFADGP